MSITGLRPGNVVSRSVLALGWRYLFRSRGRMHWAYALDGPLFGAEDAGVVRRRIPDRRVQVAHARNPPWLRQLSSGSARIVPSRKCRLCRGAERRWERRQLGIRKWCRQSLLTESCFACLHYIPWDTHRDCNVRAGCICPSRPRCSAKEASSQLGPAVTSSLAPA